MRGGFWAGLVAASVIFGASTARAECTKDLDCEGEQICEAGQCTEPKPAPATPPPPAAAPVAPSPPPQSRPVPQERERFFDNEDATTKRHVRKRIKRPALLIGGIVMAAAGAGVLMYLVATPCRPNGCANNDERGGYALMSLGLIGVGIPLIVIGAKRENVPVAGIAPWVSPQHAGLQLQLRL